MPKQSTISHKQKCTLIVSQDTHNAVVTYSKLKQITVQEATYLLLKLAFVVTERGRDAEFSR